MQRNRPRIGISAYEVTADFSHWRAMPCVMIPANYTKSVHAAGGLPLMLAPLEENVELLDDLDGLILSGGSDIGPALYGQEAQAETTPVFPHRDHAELVLLQAALERDLPVLGICRGMQLLNVARGGDLHQHLPDVLADAAPHKSAPGTWTRHSIELAPGSRLAAILGERVEGTSCHHQSPDRIGEGLVVSGRAPDGVVEGIELPGRRMAVGVLWHPEEDGERGGPLFRELVESARAYRELRAA